MNNPKLIATYNHSPLQGIHTLQVDYYLPADIEEGFDYEGQRLVKWLRHDNLKINGTLLTKEWGATNNEGEGYVMTSNIYKSLNIEDLEETERNLMQYFTEILDILYAIKNNLNKPDKVNVYEYTNGELK